MEFTKEDLEIQKQHIELDRLNKKLRKEFYLLKFYNYLKELDEKGYSFLLKATRNPDYSSRQVSQSPYYYNKRESDIVKKNDNGTFESIGMEDYTTYNQYLEDIFDKVFCYELNEMEVKDYFLKNPIINANNFTNFVDYLKDNTDLDKSFSHILSEKSNKDYINICDFKLPNMISTKQDYKLFNNKSYSIEQKIRENYADCFYILFKNIIQEVNNDKTFYFVKKDEQKVYEIQDIIMEENGYKKSIEFKDMPLEEYYALDFFLKNINIINKNNITEVISSFLDNEEHNIITVLMGKEYGKKTFINLNRFLLEEEFNKNNNVNKILNKKNRL